MRALSDALPTGHWAMANPTLQLHFGCGRATPPVSHSHNWPSGRMQIFFVQNWTKKVFFLPIKTPKLILTIEWYYRSMYCRSNAMIFFKMANLKAISSSDTLTDERNWQQSGRGIPNPITAASGGITSPANKNRWRHYMDTLSLPLVSGIQRYSDDSSNKMLVMCAWCFLWRWLKHTVWWTVELPLICESMTISDVITMLSKSLVPRYADDGGIRGYWSMYSVIFGFIL